jgi:hypothetical protein
VAIRQRGRTDTFEKGQLKTRGKQKRENTKVRGEQREEEAEQAQYEEQAGRIAVHRVTAGTMSAA